MKATDSFFMCKQQTYLTREQIRELDRIAIEEYNIPSIVLMENAGAGASRIIMSRIVSGPVVILCGKGNNGGDGFVIARHLHNQGIAVQVFFMGNLSDVEPQSDPGINLKILKKMRLLPIEIRNVSELKAQLADIQKAEIVVDALFGTGLQGFVRKPLTDIIEEIKSWNRPIVGIDIPSGLDANTGEILGTALPCFMTITFGFPKRGFICGQGPQMTGEIVVVDISLPRDLCQKFTNR